MYILKLLGRIMQKKVVYFNGKLHRDQPHPKLILCRTLRSNCTDTKLKGKQLIDTQLICHFLFLWRSYQTAYNERSVCAVRSQSSGEIPNMVISGTETPPTCCANRMFKRGNQSEESCLRGSGAETA